MEKLVLKKQRYRSTDNHYRVRVDSISKSIVEDISEKTNLCEREVASMMIKFAKENLEIEE